MAKNTDDVLAELKRVGAVGGPPKAVAVSDAVVTEVEIEQGPPSVHLRDLRGGLAAEALDDAVRHLDGVMGELTGLRESLVRLRMVWAPVEDDEEPETAPVAAPEAPLSVPEPVEGASTPPEPPSAPEASPDEETLARAREAARRKILGEDIPEGERSKMHGEEEEDVPFVGMERALPPDRQPEEITIGTVGKIKPSFPVEG